MNAAEHSHTWRTIGRYGTLEHQACAACPLTRLEPIDPHAQPT